MSPPWTHRAALFFFWALAPLAVIGVVELRRRSVRLLPLLAPFAVTVLTVALIYGQPRLRAGADVPLVLLAAVGLERASRRLWPTSTQVGATAVSSG